MRLIRGRRRTAAVMATALTATLAFAASAQAASRIYWSNYYDGISSALLAGGGGSDINTSGATVDGPYGTAIDIANGRVYWANYNGNAISYANLDGSGGGGDLNTAGATVNNPDGLVLDLATGRVYWGNRGGTTISYANLDGSGGGDLNTTGATVDSPSGVAIDTANGRIYWASTDGNTISYANLNDTGGGGDVAIPSGDVNGPQGVAIDTATGKIYWGDQGTDTIRSANLDGSGEAVLNTTGASTAGVVGVSLDLSGNRILLGSFDTSLISFASLAGAGGGIFDTTGATTEASIFPVILKPPVGTGTPVVSGGTSSGSTLSCSKGNWAPDDLGALVYDSPASYAYSWSRNGTPISGATSSTYTTSSEGAYTCTVTATNQAGSTSQTSKAHAGAPVARIEAPKPGGTYLKGTHVPTRFSCSDPHGSGIASCKDSNGASGSHGHLNTSSPGRHSYSVTAVSKDGKRSKPAQSYYVVAARIATSHTSAANGKVAVTVRCIGSAASRCSGTLILSGGRRGHAGFRITGGHSATVEVPITGTGTQAVAVVRIGGHVAARRTIAITGAPSLTG